VAAPGCDVQVGDPSLTVLDGEYQAPALYVRPGAETGDISIRNLTLYRGSTDDRGGGLHAIAHDDAWQGNLVLQSLRVLANEASIDGAGAAIHVPRGYLRLENTVFADNASGTFTSGADLVLNGHDSLVANVTVARNSTGTGPFGSG